jgi:VWFA-related protein
MRAEALKWRRCHSRAGFVPQAALLMLVLGGVAPSLTAQSPDATELSTKETEPDYKLEVERNLVQVRVVVRDSRGHTVGNLRKEDFQLSDNGKPQSISHFSVEVGQTPHAPLAPRPKKEAEPGAVPEDELNARSPRRYLALYFDDIHMPFEDVARVREAAESYLKSALTPGDRVALFTASGQGNSDFTADWDSIESGLKHIKPRGFVSDPQACPEILDYQSYLIVHQLDTFAENIATYEALHCHYQDDPKYLENARVEAETKAHSKLHEFEYSTEASLRGLDEVIGRMSVLPGQRGIVLISPGFLTVWDKMRVDQVVDRALRKNIVINALDSKGLDARLPMGDAGEQHVFTPDHPDLVGRKLQITLSARTFRAETLRDLAQSTGGVYFGDNNDLVAGLRKVSELPETYYSLAFSPERLKFDGRFHTLQIKLAHFPAYSIEARRGYFAPKPSENMEARAKEKIAEAIFSQERLSQIPIEVQTQFFKQSRLDATLSVLMHVDIRSVKFRKLNGRNLNNLTVVTALFDQNGNYLQGMERRVDFQLRDESLIRLAESGLTMKTRFTVKPGTYMVREVVRDSEGSQISGLTRTVEIPY